MRWTGAPAKLGQRLFKGVLSRAMLLGLLGCLPSLNGVETLKALSEFAAALVTSMDGRFRLNADFS